MPDDITKSLTTVPSPRNSESFLDALKPNPLLMSDEAKANRNAYRLSLNQKDVEDYKSKGLDSNFSNEPKLIKSLVENLDVVGQNRLRLQNYQVLAKYLEDPLNDIYLDLKSEQDYSDVLSIFNTHRKVKEGYIKAQHSIEVADATNEYRKAINEGRDVFDIEQKLRILDNKYVPEDPEGFINTLAFSLGGTAGHYVDMFADSFMSAVGLAGVGYGLNVGMHALGFEKNKALRVLPGLPFLGRMKEVKSGQFYYQNRNNPNTDHATLDLTSDVVGTLGALSEMSGIALNLLPVTKFIKIATPWHKFYTEVMLDSFGEAVTEGVQYWIEAYGQGYINLHPEDRKSPMFKLLKEVVNGKSVKESLIAAGYGGIVGGIFSIGTTGVHQSFEFRYLSKAKDTYENNLNIFNNLKKHKNVIEVSREDLKDGEGNPQKASINIRDMEIVLNENDDLQKEGVDPHEVFEQLGITREQYELAAKTGLHLNFNYSDLMNALKNIDNDKLSDLILQSVYTGEDSATISSQKARYIKANKIKEQQDSEGKQEIKSPEDQLREDTDKNTRAIEKEIKAYNDYLDKVYKGLSQFGFSKKDVNKQMTFLKSALTSFANRLDMPLSELTKTFPLEVIMGNLKDAHGAFRAGKTNNDPNSILLSNTASQSTVIHEMTHYFYRIMTELSSVNEGIKSDLDALNEHINKEGMDSKEGFATLFERYLLTSKAPNSKLRSLFNQVKSWIALSYKSLTGLYDYKIPEQLVPIFDRILDNESAVSEHITPQNREFEGWYDELGKVGKSVLKDFKEFKHQVDVEFSDKIADEVNKQVKKFINDMILKLPSDVISSIKHKVGTSRKYLAYYHLSKGKRYNYGSLVKSLYPTDLVISKEDVAMNHKTYQNRLSKLKMLNDKGLPLKEVMATFGYDSVEQFLDDMNDIDVKRDNRLAIEKYLLDDIIQEQDRIYHRLLSEGAIFDRVYNKLYKELYRQLPTVNKALSEKLEKLQIRKVRPGKQVLANAKAKLNKMKLGELETNSYKGSRITKENDFIANKIKGNVKEALADKAEIVRIDANEIETNNILNEVRQQKTNLKQIFSNKVEGKEIKSGGKKGYQLQSDLYELTKSLIASMGLSGLNYHVNPQDIFNKISKNNTKLQSMQTIFKGFMDTAKPLSDMTVDEFMVKTNLIEGFFEMALSEGDRGRKRDLGYRKSILSKMKDGLKGVVYEIVGENIDFSKDPIFGKALHFIKGATSGVQNAEQLAGRLDRLSNSNVFTKNLIEVMYKGFAEDKDNGINGGTEAFQSENNDLLKFLLNESERLGVPYEKVMTIDIPIGNRQSLSYTEFIMVLLNTGAEANSKKLMNTFGVTPDEFNGWLQTLADQGIYTREMNELIQSILNKYKELHGRASQAILQFSGKPILKRSETTLVTDPYKTLVGVMPLSKAEHYESKVYADQPGLSIEELIEDVENYETNLDLSQTKEVTNARYDVSLNINLLPHTFKKRLQIIHLLNPGSYVTELIESPEFKNIMAGYHKEAYRVFKNYSDAAIRQRYTTDPPTIIGSGLKYIRRAFQLGGLAFRPGTALLQFSGVFIGIPDTSINHTIQAMAELYGNRSESVKFILDNSDFMRLRGDTNVHDLSRNTLQMITRKADRRIGHNIGELADKYSYLMIHHAQWEVDMMVFLSGYYHALDNGASKEQAIFKAEALVRKTQGSFKPEHVSAVLNGKVLTKLYYTFLSHTITQFNNTFLPTHDATARNTMSVIAFRWIMPSLTALAVRYAVTGVKKSIFDSDDYRKDDKDDKGLGSFIKSLIFEMLAVRSPVPLFGVDRDLMMGESHGYLSRSLLIRTFTDVSNAINSARKILTTDKELTESNWRSIYGVATLSSGALTLGTPLPLGRMLQMIRGAFNYVMENE